MTSGPAALVAALRDGGVTERAMLALAHQPDVGLAIVGDGVTETIAVPDRSEIAAHVAAVEDALRPRWVLWSATAIAALDVHLGGCWDIAAVHRLAVGGWRADPGLVWAHHRGLDPDDVPDAGRGDGTVVDLFTAAEQAEGDPDEPVRADGHLRPEWGRPGWRPSPDGLARWASLALEVAEAQVTARAAREAGTDDAPPSPCAGLVARSESTAELLCVELARHGLPMDRATAEAIVAEHVGPRPANEAEAEEQRRVRDAVVLDCVPGADHVDLRSPGQVKSLLRRAGIEVEDTRAWRLEPLVGTHPVVEALLAWRKAERIGTTFGYAWLDDHLGADGRLRGEWSASDGAAGRMTASAGLHNMTADLRPAVVADDGWRLVRSDLGQIEPRVLAVVSGDARLAAASRADDLYAGVAETLQVDRDIAKVAVLGAMYGQTTGRGAQALAQLRTAYPVAMDHLDHADQQARSGRDLFTHGGRRLRMDSRGDLALPEHAARSRAAARGRYGRNATIQGAAAELFKLWAVTVRARARPLGAAVVLCLHDELLVHAPAEVAADVADVVDGSLQEAVARWAPDGAVRFLTDTSVVARWSDAKA